MLTCFLSPPTPWSNAFLSLHHKQPFAGGVSDDLSVEAELGSQSQLLVELYAMLLLNLNGCYTF